MKSSNSHVHYDWIVPGEYDKIVERTACFYEAVIEAHLASTYDSLTKRAINDFRHWLAVATHLYYLTRLENKTSRPFAHNYIFKDKHGNTQYEFRTLWCTAPECEVGFYRVHMYRPEEM